MLDRPHHRRNIDGNIPAIQNQLLSIDTIVQNQMERPVNANQHLLETFMRVFAADTAGNIIDQEEAPDFKRNKGADFANRQGPPPIFEMRQIENPHAPNIDILLLQSAPI